MGNDFNNLYEFADFRFDGNKLKLWHRDKPVLLSPKASELLNLLLKQNGEFVSKEEIFETIWADTFVEDGVLTQNIYTLRKILGNGADGKSLIENRTKSGYRIAVPIVLRQSNPKAEEVAVDKNFSADVSEISVSRTLPVRRFLPFVGVSVLIALLVFFAYRFFFPETAITTLRLEKLKIQKVTDTADILFPTLSADGNFAAYVRGAGSADGNIYVKDLSSSVETKIEIPNAKKFGFTAFSNDGNFIYFRNRASVFFPADILKVSRFGGEAKKIAENVRSGFSLSPDDREIVFARVLADENRHAVIIKNLENGAENEIFSVNAPDEFNLRSYPVFSPDGEKIAFLVNRQNKGFEKIVIRNLKTKQTEELMFKNFSQAEQIVWLPKKNSLLITARDEKFFRIWEISPADRKPVRITNDLSNYLTMNISADGTKILTLQHNFFTNLWLFGETEKQLSFGFSNRDGFGGIDYFPSGEIVYTSNEGDSGEINLWRINPQTGERRRLTQNAGKRNESPQVSPDGKFIFFSSERTGKSAIWQIGDNGDNPKQITSNENSNDYFPQLAPDGNTLYFLRRTGKSAVVVRKSLSDTSEEQLTQPENFSPVNFLSLAPDGKFLAFQTLTEKVQADDPQQNFQVAVIEIANPQNVKFYNLGGRIPRLYWHTDANSFTYIIPRKGFDEIFRQSLNEEKPQLLRTFPKEEIHFLNYAPDGKSFVAARGQQRNDAVLLSNFE